ncbi:MAG: YicC family protein [Candidatus Omnitrophica bacterium]|nr:YicC family protein [Candidatus Omnitrophota bacterium]
MLQSMTGFGSAEVCFKFGYFLIEIQSLNSRFCDIVVKLPSELSMFEIRLRKLIEKKLVRGRISFFLKWTKSDDFQLPRINKTLAKIYSDRLKLLKKELKLSGVLDIQTLVRFDGVMYTEDAKIQEKKVWADLEKGTNKALNGVNLMRMKEGTLLQKSIIKYINSIKRNVKKIENRQPIVLRKSREKLVKNIKETLKSANIDALGAIDKEKLLSRLPIYATNCADISEEITRIRSHIHQFLSLVNSSKITGRNLDFIVQELNREINTLGSKANDVIIAREVITIKNKLEKIKEQIQNVL